MTSNLCANHRNACANRCHERQRLENSRRACIRVYLDFAAWEVQYGQTGILTVAASTATSAPALIETIAAPTKVEAATSAQLIDAAIAWELASQKSEGAISQIAGPTAIEAVLAMHKDVVELSPPTKSAPEGFSPSANDADANIGPTIRGSTMSCWIGYLVDRPTVAG